MPVVYQPSFAQAYFYTAVAGAFAVLALAGLPWTPFCLAVIAFCIHRIFLHRQEIELTPTGLVCRNGFISLHMSYRQIGRMRFSRLMGDLVLEQPLVSIRIPRHFIGFHEIRQAVSIAVWVHRGGEVPPDLAAPDSAYV